MSQINKILNFITQRILNLSWKAINTIMIMGIVFGIMAFEKVDGLSKAKLSYYATVSTEQVYESSIVPSWHLYWIGFQYLFSYCVAGFIILLVLIELTVRMCELFNWKNNWIYKFLSSKQ